MLVCGFTGLSAESLNEIRRDILEHGFKCKVETKGDLAGFLCFSICEEKTNQWNNLLSYLKNKKGIVPFFFKEGDRLIGLEYGKECVELNSKAQTYNIALRPLLNVLSSLIWLRSGSLIKGVKMKENGNN